MAYVYRHIRLDTNKPFYIGIGLKSDGLFKRAFSKKRHAFWKSVVNKTAYDVEIIIDELTWEEACQKEKEFIQLYGRIDLNNGTLVNLTDGGDGSSNLILSKNVKEKISNSLKGKSSWLGKKHSEETKKKIAEKMKGKSPGNKGKNASDESRLKSSIAMKGNKNRIGKKHSDETKRKIGIKSAQKIPWNKGKQWNDDVKKKIRESIKNKRTHI